MRIQSRKINFFELILSDFFRKAGREELPWRKKGVSAYEVWVSEVMLQQTQVSRVIGYYNRFLGRFPDVESLAKASWEEFLPYYEGLGYYARGRNMLKAAAVIVREYAGEFPRNLETLQTIPGIGPYTAAAIMSFAFGDRHLAWDTNLRRVVGRFFLGSKKAVIDTNAFESKFSMARKKLNAALMDFGSALCTARPKCGACPLQGQCIYFREKGAQEIRSVSKKGIRQTSLIDVETVVILHEKHKLYYSSHKDKYEPFFLPKGCTTRAEIKQFFQETFSLSVAVRPPHQIETKGTRRYQYVNAQILLGRPLFRQFPPEVLQKH